MLWNKLPELNEYAVLLQEQGHTNFDPIQVKKNTEVAPVIKKMSKSATKIIEENSKRQQQKLLDDDKKMYENFSKSFFGNWELVSLKNALESLKTEESKINLLCDVLTDLIKKGKITEKFYHVFYTAHLIKNDKLEKIVEKAESLMKIDLIKVQMTKLSSYLYPLNYLNWEKQKLDDWQLDVLKKIDNKENILIVARTSAGKTVCSTYAIFTSKRSIFLVPSDELARQVAGILRNLLKGNVALYTNKDTFIENNSFKVMVGTPLKIEEYLIMNGVSNYDYVVCDEVHQIRDCDHEGDAYERVISLLPSETKLLLMSATVENPSVLKSWIEAIKGQNVDLVLYNKRFIVQQRHLWNGDVLEKLHPFSSLETNTDLTENLTMTPSDLYNAYEKLKNFVSTDLYQKFAPTTYFKKNIITQDDVRDYEIYFKQNLALCSRKHEFLKSYHKNVDSVENLNLVKLLKTLRDNHMTPVLIFKDTTEGTIQCFREIILKLEEEESKNFPYYKNDLLTLQHFYDRYLEDVSKFDKAEKPKNVKSFQEYKENSEIVLMEKYLKEMKQKFSNLISSRITKVMEDPEITNKEALVTEYKKELERIMLIDSLGNVDIYRPHPEYTFTKSVDSDFMRKVKKRLTSSLDFKFSYEHVFLRGIERGVVLYHKEMSSPFQREVQSLINQKKIDFVVSDDSLAYGINMPIKTVVLLGDHNKLESWDTVKATQMLGRSGRRGIDREGHVVFANVNWKEIIRVNYPTLQGIHSVTQSLTLPLSFSKNVSEDELKRQHNITFNEFRENQYINATQRFNSNKTVCNLIKKDYHKTMWDLRFLGSKAMRIKNIVDKLKPDTEIEELFDFSCNFLFDEDTASALKVLLTENRILSSRHLERFHLTGNLLIELYKNSDSPAIKHVIKNLFDRIKTLVSKGQFLE